jgi:Tol biopolymer transport system component
MLVGLHSADAAGLLRPVMRAQPIDGSAATDSVALPGDGDNVQWSPDGHGILYLATADPAANVMRLGFGAPTPTPVTRFTRGRIESYLPSPDGTRLALSVRDGGAENVWITAADGSNPRQVTQFTNEEVFEMHWVDAHRTLAISAGTITNDVVLIRDFR